MSRRITTMIERWVEQALDEQALGDRVTWDYSFRVTEQGPEVLVCFFMPGAVLGTAAQTVALLEHIHQVTEPDISGMVRTVLENLREQRSKQASLSPETEGQMPLFEGMESLSR